MTIDASFAGLPAEIRATIVAASVAEWVSSTRRGLAIDTPALMFANPEAGTLDVTTGLAYPAKAERARREPRVGLAVGASGAGQPVVVMRALAAVRDADIQSNTDRYLSLFAPMLPVIGSGAPWSQCREAIWYWARVFIENTVTRILWWPDAEHLDDEASQWDADMSPAPGSDPAPRPPASASPAWPMADWRARAREVLADGVPAWLSRRDADGYPLPFPVRELRLCDEGLALDVPRGHPWPALDGTASINFGGRATLVGELDHDGSILRIERTIADLPMVAIRGRCSNLNRILALHCSNDSTSSSPAVVSRARRYPKKRHPRRSSSTPRARLERIREICPELGATSSLVGDHVHAAQRNRVDMFPQMSVWDCRPVEPRGEERSVLAGRERKIVARRDRATIALDQRQRARLAIGQRVRSRSRVVPSGSQLVPYAPHSLR